MPTFDLFEAIHTQRSIRRFKPDPVPPELVRKVLEAATKAPSGSNRQPWNFVVMTDPEVKRQMGDIYKRAGEKAQAARSPRREASQQDPAPRPAPTLVTSPEEVPVLIMVCIQQYPTHGSQARWGSIFPAVQNLMLAARALGLGTVPTTLHHWLEDEVKQLLNIPENMDTAALIPMGYPAEGEHFGGSRRKPVEEVAFQDRWGNPFK